MNKVLFLLALVCGIVGIAVGSIGLVTATPSDNAATALTELLPYTNKDYGFSIGYPSNWTIREFNLAPNEVVAFEGPQSEVHIVVQSMERLKGLNIHEAVLMLNYSLKNDPNVRLIKSNHTTISEFPALQQIYYSSNIFTNKKVMEAMALSNNTNTDMFSFNYVADPAYFDRYLPVAKEMLASMKINSTNE